MSDHGSIRMSAPTLDPSGANGYIERGPDPIRRADGRRGMIAGRTPWLDLPAPWDNLEIRAWVDYPKHIADLWTPSDDETVDDASARIMLACQNTFLDHRARCDCRSPENGDACRVDHGPWETEDGPMPATSDAEFWERLPTPLFKAIITRFSEEIAVNPTKRASRKWKPRSSRPR